MLEFAERFLNVCESLGAQQSIADYRNRLQLQGLTLFFLPQCRRFRSDYCALLGLKSAERLYDTIYFPLPPSESANNAIDCIKECFQAIFYDTVAQISHYRLRLDQIAGTRWR
jgi:hypothetical protein